MPSLSSVLSSLRRAPAERGVNMCTSDRIPWDLPHATKVRRPARQVGRQAGTRRQCKCKLQHTYMYIHVARLSDSFVSTALLLFIHSPIPTTYPLPYTAFCPSPPPADIHNVARYQHTAPQPSHILLKLFYAPRNQAHIAGWHGWHRDPAWTTIASLAFFVQLASCRYNQRRPAPLA